MVERTHIEILLKEQAEQKDGKTEMQMIKHSLEWVSLAKTYFRDGKDTEAVECCDNYLRIYDMLPESFQFDESKQVTYSIIGLKAMCLCHQNDPQKVREALSLLSGTIKSDPKGACINATLQKALKYTFKYQ
jgi:hypothetical protein